MNRLLLFVFIMLTCATSIVAQFPINVLRPYDIDLHWMPQPAGTWEFGVVGEFSTNVEAYNHNGDKVNVLQLWQPTVSGLAMLRGFPEGSEIGQLNSVLSGVPDDGVRGHMVPTGSLSIKDMSFVTRYFFPYNLSLGVYVPWYSMKLSDITWKDLTGTNTLDDLLVRDLLTNNWDRNVYNLSGSFDCEGKYNLNVGDSWTRTGIGDMTILGIWSKNFPQKKPILKNVCLTGRFGVTAPTGKRTNEDVLLQIPYGNDGAWGVVGGLTIELQWWQCFRGGVQADFWKPFGDERHRRIKTDVAQSDLVLLANVPTYKEWGLTRRYTLYLETGNFNKGLSLGCAYQYFNSGDDHISVVSNDYTTSTAAKAQTLEEWKLHNVIVNLNAELGSEEQVGRTRVSFFYKQPFNGTRVIAASTFGARIAIDF